MDVPTRQSYAMALVSAEERSAATGIAGVARSTGAAINPLFDPAHAEKQCRGFEFELCSQRRPDRKSNLDCWLRIFADDDVALLASLAAYRQSSRKSSTSMPMSPATRRPQKAVRGAPGHAPGWQSEFSLRADALTIRDKSWFWMGLGQTRNLHKSTRIRQLSFCGGINFPGNVFAKPSPAKVGCVRYL
jgi:hypothetical protein